MDAGDLLSPSNVLDLAVLGVASERARTTAEVIAVVKRLGGRHFHPTADVVAGRVAALAEAGLLAPAPGAMAGGPWRPSAVGRAHLRRLPLPLRLRPALPRPGRRALASGTLLARGAGRRGRDNAPVASVMAEVERTTARQGPMTADLNLAEQFVLWALRTRLEGAAKRDRLAEGFSLACDGVSDGAARAAFEPWFEVLATHCRRDLYFASHALPVPLRRRAGHGRPGRERAGRGRGAPPSPGRDSGPPARSGFCWAPVDPSPAPSACSDCTCPAARRSPDRAPPRSTSASFRSARTGPPLNHPRVPIGGGRRKRGPGAAGPLKRAMAQISAGTPSLDALVMAGLTPQSGHDRQEVRSVAMPRLRKSR
jgi:hypothetical protein